LNIGGILSILIRLLSFIHTQFCCFSGRINYGHKKKKDSIP
jgi:hypothetical protein